MLNQPRSASEHVVPFPNTGAAKWAVSTHGGAEPLWTHGGSELFYRDGARDLVAVEVKTTPTFSLVVDNWFDELKGRRGESDWLACSRVAVVSVVVSIQMSKM